MSRSPSPSRPRHRPDAAPSAQSSFPLRPVLPYAPEPLQVRVVRRAQPDGVGATGIFRVWEAAEGRRCRLCPAGLCNLSPVDGTPQATCIVVVQGAALPGVPPAVTFRG